jgi:hypothetical protein
MSGPPHKKEGRVRASAPGGLPGANAGLGSAGAMSGPPHKKEGRVRTSAPSGLPGANADRA